jgi:hypothetical protein
VLCPAIRSILLNEQLFVAAISAACIGSGKAAIAHDDGDLVERLRQRGLEVPVVAGATQVSARVAQEEHRRVVTQPEKKEMPSRLVLALRANSIEIETMTDNIVSSARNQFLIQVCKTAQFRVDDLLAFQANKMGMGVRIVSIIPVLTVAEFQLQDFSQFLDDRDGLVDGGQAGGREVDFDLLENILNARMVHARRQGSDYGKSLRRDPIPLVLQFILYHSSAVLTSAHNGRLRLIPNL